MGVKTSDKGAQEVGGEDRLCRELQNTRDICEEESLLW